MDRKTLLQELLDSRFGGSQAEFARAIKRSPAQVHQWMSGYRTIGDAGARHIEITLELPTGWMDGKNSNLPPVTASPAIAPESGYITFDLLNVEAAAGTGLVASENPEVLQRVNVLESWAKEAIGGNLNRIRLITASGDSMTPTFNDRDVLFVDETVREYRSEGIYIIDTPDGLRAKRLQRLMDGSLRILCDNHALYPHPDVVTGEVLNSIRICGKVVASWNFRKI